MFQTRGRIHFTIPPDPEGNRAKRLAPRRVPWAPDSSIHSPVRFPSFAFTLAPGSGVSARRAAPKEK
jgi:hypothetical protein